MRMQREATTTLAKSEMAKKAELVKELNQFKIKIMGLEREKRAHVYNRHSDFRQEFAHLQELDAKDEADRKTEKVHVRQQLSKIRNMVRKFHREIQDVKPTPEFVEKLKVIMEEVESQISAYKDQQRHIYEELIKEERVAVQEVTALDKRFESWSQKGAVSEDGGKTGRPLAATERNTPRDLPQEVMEFENFVTQSGGPRGGWDEYDHATFMKYRNRHKGRIVFLQDLMGGSLPTHSDQEVRDHERWYQQYLALNDKKKEAIQKWKERKEVEKEEVINKAEEDAMATEEMMQKQQEAEQRAIEAEKQERRAQLNRWKVEKELQKAEEEERKLRAELNKQQKADLEKQRKLAIKQEVDEFRAQRQQHEEERHLEEQFRHQVEQEEKQRMAAHIIPLYRQRAISSAKGKYERLKQQKESAQQQKDARLEKLKSQVEVRVARDPSRLLQPTAGWIERQKQQETSGGQVLHMPHRATPSWRQGMQ